MMKVILMHGKDTNPTEKWYPWFKEELEKKEIKVHVPELPDSSEPNLLLWLDILATLKPDEETVLVGHSRGGVAVLRYIERLPLGAKVKKVILIAANAGSAKYQETLNPAESNFGFYTKDGYDFETIQSHCDNFVVYHSEDDQWVPFAHGKENAEGLGAEFRVFKDKHHFGKDDGIVPGLIEEVLT